MNKKSLASILMLTFASFAVAQENNPILTAVPSLSIAPDSRAGGMGDVGAATTPDVNSQFWNPSKYVFMESQAGVSISYTPWLRKLVDDIDLAYAAGYWKLDSRQAFSASLRYFSLGSISLMDELGIPQNSVNPNELAVDAAYSRLLSDKLSASVALRYILSDLGINSEEMHKGSTVAADVSAYYKTPISLETGDGQLAFGLNASNIGGKISFDNGSNTNFIPTNLRLGTSFDYPLDAYNRISFSGDANKLMVPTPANSTNSDFLKQASSVSSISGVFSSFSDAPGGMKEELREISYSVGAEYAYNKQFFVRGGYYYEDTYKGNRKYFTAGAGFKLNVMQLDAAYIIATTPSNPLDGTLRLSISFDMLGMKELLK
jgi:hypothetical protein